MKNLIEVLLSVMNLKNEKDYLGLLKENNITSSVVAINQVDKDEDIFNMDNFRISLNSYKEKGASISRNKLLEKARGDICLFADDDIKYVTDYETIIEKEYRKNDKADIIIFYVQNKNQEREKNKKIGNKKINFIDTMKIRTYEITLRKKAIEKIIKNNIRFDNNFGPGATFYKGEETVFINDLLKSNFKIYSVNKTIAIAENKESSWFNGYNKKFLYDQGAIFYRITPKFYEILILQYIIRKYLLYKKSINIKQAFKLMLDGAKKCKKIYNNG